MTRPFTTAGEDSTMPPVAVCHSNSGALLPSTLPSKARRSGPPRNAVHSSKPIEPLGLTAAGDCVVVVSSVVGAAVVELGAALVSASATVDGAAVSGASLEHPTASSARTMVSATERGFIGSFDRVKT